MKLLENLAATSETENFGPDEDTRENQSKEVPYKPLPLSDSLSYEARATDIDEFQMFETNDMFDEAEQMPAAEGKEPVGAVDGWTGIKLCFFRRL